MTVTPHRITSLLHFLESHSPSITSLVRNLVVDDFSEWALGDDGETRLSFPADKLRRIFSLLSVVEHLHIHNCYHVINPKMFLILASVRELVMEDIRLNSLEHTLAFVYAFPMLETLSIVGKSTWGDRSLPSKYNTRPRQPSFSIRKLDLDDTCLSSISKWLLGLDPVPTISTLSLYAVVPDGPQGSMALLHSIGPSVLKLELKLRNPFASYVPLNIIDISNCTNLRTVHLIDIVTNPNTLNSLTSPLIQLLSQITCPSVQELIIKFRKPDGIIFDWTCLANALANPKFDHLQVIHVQSNVYSIDEDAMLSERNAWQVAERSIRQTALSVFDQRGLLHFTLFRHYKGSRVKFA